MRPVSFRLGVACAGEPEPRTKGFEINKISRPAEQMKVSNWNRPLNSKFGASLVQSSLNQAKR